MFGFVGASAEEMTREQKDRYGKMYCGICRDIRASANQRARFCLSYDMVFLAMLLSSLYEPGETEGEKACLVHPCRPRGFRQNEFTAYAADMNIALAYYNCLDDWKDEKKLPALMMARDLEKFLPDISSRWPRQCREIEKATAQISELERDKCPTPDIPAGCFGQLMEELLVYREDHWEQYLRRTGNALGRFIYLCDAAMDLREDEKKGRYNPFLMLEDRPGGKELEEFLVLTMASCTQAYEMLPLVQDKDILDNILYSGVWLQYGSRQRRLGREEKNERSV